MAHEILTVAEMAEADRLTIAAGPGDGVALMRRAGEAVAAAVLERFPAAATVHILCGPGNNGGDGYVAARLLHEAGSEVRVWRSAPPRAGSDAWTACAECPLDAGELDGFAPGPGALVIDALFGAGLSKPLTGSCAAAIRKAEAAGAKVLSVDLPSGVSGDGGAALGPAFRAEVTVTFFRKKHGHLLHPGRELCGETIVADIGIRDDVLDEIRPSCHENTPAQWVAQLPRPAADTHKYRRGHVAVFSGGPSSTGAARLSAAGSARAGAGAVTLLSPGEALMVNAAQLTSTMLRRADDAGDLRAFIADRKPSAFVLGPGFGVGEKLRQAALAILETAGAEASLVLDADAFTSFADAPASLFAAAGSSGAPALMLTPHEGEFGRLFPDLAGDLSKVDRARKAAARSHGVVILKGPDTVIAAPDGRAAINANGSPFLATAGSGDVLAGICAGLLAQGMPAWEAACAAVWVHAETGRRFGPGLIAEDLPGLLPAVLRELL